MVLLKSTVCLLLIISFAEAQISCVSDCVPDKTAENDIVTYECVVPHVAGNTVPVLTWLFKRDKKEVPFALNHIKEPTYTARKVSLKAAAPDLDKLVCLAETHNAPNVTCYTEPCKILYSVRKVTTWPFLFVSPGEEIKCSAEGNPEPKFYWQMKDDGGDDKWTNIPDATSDKIDAQLNNGTSTHLRCVAWNTVKGTMHTDHSASITVSKDGALIRNAIIGSVVALIVIVIIVVGIIHVKCPQYLPCKLSDIVKCDGD